ncbi:SRPBCC family protein [Zhouia sp. PK063]|uniref:SRPBCC family protein n=1 Tax=Zhouia sp. PK063 TaxID=3373602 RepID=UPI0037B931F1
MKVFKYVFILLLLIIIVISIYIAIQPDSYNVSRSKTMEASPHLISSYINNYKTWPEWSPWLKLEPDANLTYGEKTSGVDATYAWKGNQVGEGEMKTTYVAKDSIHQQIHFIQPFESSAEVYWTLERKNDSTTVVWGMKGNMNFMSKAYALFTGGMDKAIGKDFEAGLHTLDSVTSNDLISHTITFPGETDYSGGYYIYQTTESNQKNISAKMATMFPNVINFMKSHNISASGKPFTKYVEWNDENQTVIFSVCIPVSERIIIADDSDILCGFIDAGKYYKSVLQGNYKFLSEAWTQSFEKLTKDDFVNDKNRDPLEIYNNTPESEPNPSKWNTQILIPITTNTETKTSNF